VAKAAVAVERGIELELGEDSWLGDVPVKSQALTTILGNLIDNALDAAGGTRSADQGPGKVTFSLVEDEDFITVEVRDNGPGIPDAVRDSIFLDGFSTKPASGTLRRGLGLALVHRLVQRLGGHIEVGGGVGAVFTVRIPTEVETPTQVSALAGKVIA